MHEQPIPGPKGNFILGSMRDMQRDPLAFLLAVRKTYGAFARFRLGPNQVYLISDPALVQQALVTQSKIIWKADFNKKLLSRFLGKGILTSDGDFHRKQRRLVQPAFHHKQIAGYADSMVQHTLNLLNTWQTGGSRNIDDDMMRLTMDIVTSTLFGTDVTDDANRVGEAIATLQAITVGEFKAGFMLPDWVPASRNRRRRAAAQVMGDTVLKFIRERRATGEVRDDLLAMLLQAQDEDDGSTMTDEQVRDEAVTLFAAGHETTSNALTWAWYLLAQQPTVMATLQEELARVLGGRPPTLQDLAALPYTEMVMKEAMRLYPPAWMLMSRSPQEPITLNGTSITPGDWLFIAPYVMHRDPDIFPNPELFDPARFAEDQADNIPRYAYIPFGAGPRICIGNSFAMMEARLILATIAQRFDLTLDPGQEIVPEPEITLRPRYGLHMTVNAREAIPTA